MYSGYCCVSSGFVYGAFTLSGRSFQDRSTTFLESRMQSEPRSARTSVWALTISLAATLVIDVSFSSSGYLDVSVHRVPHHSLWIGLWLTGVCPAGFPHSDICGSMCICHSPQLFAAYHVFHRLLVPRHSPCALFAFFLSIYLDFSIRLVNLSILFSIQFSRYIRQSLAYGIVRAIQSPSGFFITGFRPIKRQIHVCSRINASHPYIFRLALLNAYVEMVRFELMTPCLQGRCSPN